MNTTGAVVVALCVATLGGSVSGQMHSHLRPGGPATTSLTHHTSGKTWPLSTTDPHLPGPCPLPISRAFVWEPICPSEFLPWRRAHTLERDPLR